jgi:nucleoside-triphosphatase
MKSNLLITGSPGVGKTTLVLRVLADLPAETACGFITQELRQGGRRVGFEVQTLGGESGVLAHTDIKSRHRVGRYGVDVASFEKLALPTLDATNADASLIVIDEIGKMECFSARFRETVVNALDAEQAVLATIPLRGKQFIEKLKARPDVTLLRITRQNRDELAQQVQAWIKEAISSDQRF